MTGYLLDTNIISDLIRNPSGAVARHIETIEVKDIFTSIIVAAELRYGCAKKGSFKLTEKVESLLATIPVLSLETPVDAEYGNIRSELKASGTTISMNDLLIAAQAHTLNLTLVSDNLREFSRAHGFKIEN